MKLLFFIIIIAIFVVVVVVVDCDHYLILCVLYASTPMKKTNYLVFGFVMTFFARWIK